MAGKLTLWDQLLAGTCNAVADIRQKLVEEPWFGRVLDVPDGEFRETKHAPGYSLSRDQKPSCNRSTALQC